MTLVAGARLGPYEILSAIGAGGMGEVYKARDTRLDRTVAIKVLPSHLADRPELRERFEREAKAIASLNHPHICILHDVGHQDGTDFLVMEYLEGETLADRLLKGPLPLDQVLFCAIDIADALDKAHRKSVTHRDIKPGNILLTKNGAKLLDFGLAKLKEAAAPADSFSQMPTLSHSPTAQGMLLGTMQYMAPEQVEGRNDEIDGRTDIFAFGAVVYEMATGKKAFEGKTNASLIAAIIRADPPLISSSQPMTPPALDRVVRKCLAKDPDERWQTARDLHDDLKWIAEGGWQGGSTTSVVARNKARERLLAGIAVIGLVAAALSLGAAVYVWRTRSSTPQITHSRLAVTPADEVSTGSTLDIIPGGSSTALAWSPNGRTLAFVGQASGARLVYMRDLDSDKARPLEGTEGAQSLTFSPDGEWIAFWANGQLRKVRISGGPPARLCDTQRVSGMSWGAARIVFSQRGQLYEASPDGGEPRVLAESTERAALPFLLPGDAAVLYTEYGKNWTSGDERVMVRSLTTADPPKMLLKEAADARYLTTGSLAFLRQGTIFVVPFDAEKLEVRGSAVAVLKDVAQSVASWYSEDLTLAGQWAISPQGALAYVASPTPLLPRSEPVTVNRLGRVAPLSAPAGGYRERIESSPNGKTVAVSVQTTTSVGLYLYELARGTLTPPFAEPGDRELVRPVWSSDGKIAVEIIKEGTGRVAVFRPDSPAPPETLSDSEKFTPSAWSPDGNLLAGSKGGDLWVYSSTGDGSLWTQLTKTEASESFPAWSPDGQWLAYVSTVSGRSEVYVQPYPGPGTAIPVSTNGGSSPAWNPRGGELFYTEFHQGEANDWRMMSVDMTTPRHPGRPVPLFSFSSESLLLATCYPTACYSVTPDGEAFFALRMLPRQPARVTEIRLILNWFEELKRLVPTN